MEHLQVNADLIISAGGENFVVYLLDKNKKISKAVTGNKCASGTGEFFLQQIKRMNLPVEEAIELGVTGSPYNISGRCSVFCKSDCTHALNKGVSKNNVVAGLSKMMAQKIIELTSKIPYKNALLIGGVSRNKAVLKFLHENLHNLEITDEAAYFEALGASIFALKNDTFKTATENLINYKHSNFTFHDDLKNHLNKVHFKNGLRGEPNENDECILGLDVGSTTTKAVLMRTNDNNIIALEYLRTNGDPVNASIECYKSLKQQLNVSVKIVGLGVTGSGRHIAGMQALTKGVINEIIAHAAATVYFDKEADTIFEIGGQDAKYTYITAGVPSDYAMNEACSAGTGSFLEEAAKESLEVDYLEIGDIALRADSPPNFNDQCSAFISSDIKNALHEGLSKEDIVAGLVYSICLNYINRVKGNRPAGKKIFMQGGVCYNKAVPVAMAALTCKEIIVPPEPGLMGAFGVALEIKNRFSLKLLEKEDFSLDTLINRKVNYDKSFICAGGNENCDRKCSVSIINIDGKRFPFGGACNKYYNIEVENVKNIKEKNLVALRQQLVFEKYLHQFNPDENAKTIGIPKSFLVNSYFPLYYNFFSGLGFNVIIGDEPKPSGIDKKESAFCFPVELAHGFFRDLIDKKVDYIFLPHILEVFNGTDNFYDRTCVLLQAEVYYLKTAFKEELNGIEILAPVLNFAEGFEQSRNSFVNIATGLGKEKIEAYASFDFAVNELNNMFAEFKVKGKIAIDELEKTPEQFAVVLFGRAYSAFAKEANLAIPQKFTTRNFLIIPHDFLSSEMYESFAHMYWGAGKQILRNARLVKEHPQLFGVYITNFSCGPDSILLGYFRDIMGSKPSLTLELDSHSADAGINTRIEAAIDIIKSYRTLQKNGNLREKKKEFHPLKVKDSHTIIDADGNEISIFNPEVKFLIPSMGRYASEAFSAAFRYIGINSEPLPVYDFNTLTTGRGNTSCKECLPLILNSGAMIDYCKSKPENEKSLLFMAEGTGPCRFGQYHVYLNELIRKKELHNTGIYTLSDEDSYGGLGNEFVMRGWAAITTADAFQDIHHAILAIAEEPINALIILKREWKKIVKKIEKESLQDLFEQLKLSAEILSRVKRKIELKDAVKVGLIGEIYVRNDEFSRIDLIERLAAKNIVVKVAPIGDYVYYSNYLAKNDGNSKIEKLKNRLSFSIRDLVQVKIEKNIKKNLSGSGFLDYELLNIKETVKYGANYINPVLEGEAILTVGSGLREVLDHVSGVISIGPFGCMPSRVAESILNVEMNIEGKAAAMKKQKSFYNENIGNLPFLAIETDGNIFPQIIQSKIEIFILQAERLHKLIKSEGIKGKRGFGFLNLLKKHHYDKSFGKVSNEPNLEQFAPGME